MKKVLTSTGCITNMSASVETMIMKGLFPEADKERVAGYAGERGSFCHDGALQYFAGQRIERFVPYRSRVNLLTDLHNGRIDYGVIPLEYTGQGCCFAAWEDVGAARVYAIGEGEVSFSQVHVYRPACMAPGPVHTVYIPVEAQAMEWLPADRLLQLRYTASLQEAVEGACSDEGCAVLTHGLGARIYHLEPVECLPRHCSQGVQKFTVLSKTCPAVTASALLICRIMLKAGETIFDAAGRLEAAGLQLVRIDTKFQESGTVLFVTVRCRDGQGGIPEVLKKEKILGVLP